MKSLALFAFWLCVALIALFLTIVLGGHGAWYFAWVLGTVMIVLIGAAGGALLDWQEEEPAREESTAGTPHT